jgi:hypothetical protein
VVEWEQPKFLVRIPLLLVEKRVLADEERVISTGLIEMLVDRQVT